MTNEESIDATVAHQIDMLRVANWVVREEMGRLNEDDEALFALLVGALMALPANASPEQIDAALGMARFSNEQTYAAIERDLNTKLQGVTDTELTFQDSLLGDEAAQPSGGQTFAEMIRTPIMGVVLAEMIRGLAVDRFQTIRSTVQAGFVARRSVPDILRELRGTKSAGYADGTLNRTRLHLETTIRTAVAHAVEFAAAAVHALNPDIVRAVVWLSVLDGRTSPPCIARSGKRYTADAAHRPLGHSLSWGAGPGRYHYNCRSTAAPLVAGEVPSPTRFQDWLRRQPAATQDDVLGPTRGRMYRSGQVSVEGFLNNKGKLLTLDQLKARGM